MITALIYVYGIIDDLIHEGDDGYSEWFDGSQLDTGAMVGLAMVDITILFWIDKIFF